MDPALQPREQRAGVLYGLSAYGAWGLFPLYWVLLAPAGAVEVLAHRIVWTLVVVVLLLWLIARHRDRPVLPASLLRDRRRVAMLALAATLLSANWGTYIWAVTHGHVVETSLGYFVNPLVSVLAGVLVLGERLPRARWVAVGLGAAAVVVLTVGYGRPPWIALTLAFSFGTYGLIKKFVAAGAVESLAVETTAVALPALAYLMVIEAAGSGTFLDNGAGHAVLLAAGGAITAAPLLAFGAAANRVPLSLLGLMQYLTPVLQFALGVLVFGERMPAVRWFGFALVWLALAVLVHGGLRRRR